MSPFMCYMVRNALWPSDAIRRVTTRSSLLRGKFSSYTTPFHCPNQCQQKQNLPFHKMHMNMSSAKYPSYDSVSKVLIRSAWRSWHIATYLIKETCGCTTSGSVFVCMNHHGLSAQLSGPYCIKLYHLYAIKMLEHLGQIQWGPFIARLIIYIQETHDKHTLPCP